MNTPHGMSSALTIDVGRVKTGLWCPRCLKPSGYRAELLTMSTRGVSIIGTITRCDEGDHPLRLPGDLA